MSDVASILVGGSDTIRRAMEAISEGRSGIALMVDGGGRLVGTVSDGDIRRALLTGKTLSSSVEDVASRQFVSVGVGEDRGYVLDLMQSRQIRQIPIVDREGRPVGLHLMREIVGGRPRPNVAVIMAGGRGERLRPITDTIPKPMVKVAGRPILERLVLHLVGHGIRKFYFCVNYKAEIIERYFGDGQAFGCSIHYVHEEKPLHSGGALSLLPERPKQPFLLLNGDLVTQVDVREMLDCHERASAMITVGVTEYSHIIPFGCLKTLADGTITDICEKPTVTETVNAGIYVINPEALSWIPYNEPYPVTNLLSEALRQGVKVQSFAVGGWLDVGRVEQLRQANGVS